MLLGLNNKYAGHASRLFIFLTVSLWSFPVIAQNLNVSGVNAQTLVQNVAANIPLLMRFVTALGYVMGMYFIIAGLMKLKQYGESRTMMSHEHSLKAPVIFIVVGTLLLYLPTSVQVGMSTFWTVPCPYCYMDQQDQWSQFFTNAFLIMQLFGVIAFIRGLIILSHLGGHGGSQPGTFGKAMTHIIAGIFCINIYQFIQLVLSLFGVSFS